jgi:hypothetical protein
MGRRIIASALAQVARRNADLRDVGGLRAMTALCAVAASLAGAAPASAALHVSPTGSDAADGSVQHPLRTLPAAVALANRTGAQVLLASGTYPLYVDRVQRQLPVSIASEPGQRATLAGAQLQGASGLRFSGILFTRPAVLTISQYRPGVTPQLTHDVVFDHDEFVSTPAFVERCMTIRSGTHDVVVDASWFHDCESGIGGPNDAPLDPRLRFRCEHLTFTRNWIGPVHSDGFQFGHWQDVTIAGNEVRRQHDPLWIAHTDAIQFTGDDHDVRIIGNDLDQGGQLIFVQAAFGPISNVLVQNNLLHDSDNFPVKVSGVDGITFVHNTVWHTKWGAMLVRDGVSNLSVVGNVLDFLSIQPGTTVTARTGNFVRKSFVPAALGDLPFGDPRFVAPDVADYRLPLGSPALGAGCTLGPADLPAPPPGEAPPGMCGPAEA